jgi:hypothetical protein
MIREPLSLEQMESAVERNPGPGRFDVRFGPNRVIPASTISYFSSFRLNENIHGDRIYVPKQNARYIKDDEFLHVGVFAVRGILPKLSYLRMDILNASTAIDPGASSELLISQALLKMTSGEMDDAAYDMASHQFQEANLKMISMVAGDRIKFDQSRTP